MFNTGEILYGIGSINLISVAIVVLFLLPILGSIFYIYSRENIRYSIDSIIGNLEFLIGLVISIYLTKKIFFENEWFLYKDIYEIIPKDFRVFLNGKDILTYLICVPIILLLIKLIIKLITFPFYNLTIEPLTNIIYSIFESMNEVLKRFVAVIFNLPKAIFLVFVFGLLINFYSYYFYIPEVSECINESGVYKMLYNTAIEPALNSNLAKRIPVILNDSFGLENGEQSYNDNDGLRTAAKELVEKLGGGNIRIIEYFNGVTLDEAIKSNDEIAKTAKEVVGNETNSRKKAYLLYKWVSSNIKYDYEKAERISKDSGGISSGSITAYSGREGICFDYSCLYVTMCKEVGLKVRLITGLGFSGVSWGDHAWNSVYCTEEERWINVDATFGSSGDYFDKTDFSVDHKYEKVQGEW